VAAPGLVQKIAAMLDIEVEAGGSDGRAVIGAELARRVAESRRPPPGR